ncbi:uncharacterized protein ZBAI_02428 [Zygosaccharomyces bailii ISA1307]|nr:uncharacterized protein ZBAI_02428 [Zygosaccharomyces bailii ISA1307]
MQLYLIYVLWALKWSLASANSSKSPKVTKGHVFSSNVATFSLPFASDSFKDSDTLFFLFNDTLQVSYDNGKAWRVIEEIGSNISSFWIDGQERAFAKSFTQDLYMTEDQGRDWRQIQNPCGLESRMVSVETNPFDQNCMLLTCGEAIRMKDDLLGEWGHAESTVFISKDGGRKFEKLVEPVAPRVTYRVISAKEKSYGTRCHFAASSTQSTLQKDWIYCIEEVEGHTQEQEQRTDYKRQIIFYSTDLGSSTETVEEFGEDLVLNLQILRSRIMVKTLEITSDNTSTPKVWISTGDIFRLSSLPDSVSSLAGSLFEDDLGGLFCSVEMIGSKEKHLVYSDPTGMNFSFVNLTLQDQQPSHIFLKKDEILKGAILANIRFLQSDRILVENESKSESNSGSWWSKMVAFMRKLFFNEKNKDLIGFEIESAKSVTKNSFDNGRTWSNLRVVDPSNAYASRFECDLNDIKNCSLHESMTNSRFSTKDEPTVGIMLTQGAVGNASSIADTKYTSTFISRDGGASWEIAFDSPMLYVFADFGNIIVAIPDLSYRLNAEYSKFYVSLDQGHTWDEHLFEEPVPANLVVFHSSGLEIIIRFTTSSYEKDGTHFVQNIFYELDFSNVFDGEACNEEDMETWYVAGGECVNGVRYSFKRRKQDAQCLVRKAVENIQHYEEICDMYKQRP